MIILIPKELRLLAWLISGLALVTPSQAQDVRPIRREPPASPQALTTLTDTNANGVLVYSDPSAVNLNRRFYRVLLLPP